VNTEGFPLPVIVAHDLEQAEAALRASAASGVPVCLLSAPHAAAVIGAPALIEMFAAASKQAKHSPARTVIGCGDAAGRAMAALRAGATSIAFDTASPAADRIASLAKRHGAEVVDIDIYETALDLGPVGDAREACHTFLGNAQQGNNRE